MSASEVAHMVVEGDHTSGVLDRESEQGGAALEQASSVSVPADQPGLSSTLRKLHSAANVVKAVQKLAGRASMQRYTMPFGDLNMSELMHACATGNHVRVAQRINELHSDGSALQEELSVVDDWAGSTPLHWAAYSGNARVVLHLLCEGAKVDAQNRRDGSMPIHLAARYGRTAALVALADDKEGRQCINALNNLGNRPLHECAYEGHAEGAEALITRRADLEAANALEKGGLTPLLAAIEYGHLRVIRVLLKAGADVHTAPLDFGAIQAPSRRFSGSSMMLRRSRWGSTGRGTQKALRRQESGLLYDTARLKGAHRASGWGNSGRTVTRFDLPGEAAINLALETSHLDVVSELPITAHACACARGTFLVRTLTHLPTLAHRSVSC